MNNNLIFLFKNPKFYLCIFWKGILSGRPNIDKLFLNYYLNSKTLLNSYLIVESTDWLHYITAH